MGELLASMLRHAMYGVWMLCFGLGLYASAALLTADVRHDEWASMAKRYLQRGDNERASQISSLQQAWPTGKLAWAAAKRPDVVWYTVVRLVPALFFPQLGDHKEAWQPQMMTNQRLVQHIFIPMSMALLIAMLFEFGLYPLLRSRLARWLADPNEQPFGRLKDIPTGDGFVLGQNVRLDRPTSFRHVLTIGPSGSSKSASQVMPSLLQLPDDAAAVVSDVKYELYCRTAEFLESRGHPVYVLAPAGGFGMGWDPLRECDTPDGARELARQILVASAAISGQVSSEWENMSESLLSAYLVEALQRNLGLVEGVERMFAGEDGQAWIQGEPAKFDLSMFKSLEKSERTAGSVYGTLQKTLRPWTRDQVAGFLSHPNRLDIRTIRRQKAVVFLCSTAHESAQLAAIQNVFWQRLFGTLGAQAGENACYCLLDEFANVGRLEGIDRALNLLRSARVGIHALIQNPPQIEAVYGPQFGRLVRASFGTVSVLPGLRDGADEVARWLGSREEIRDTYSTADEKLRSTFTQNKKDVLSPELIRQLHDDQVLVVTGNKRPVIAKTVPWYRIKRLAGRVPAQFRMDWGRVQPADVRAAVQDAGMIAPRPLKVAATSKPAVPAEDKLKLKQKDVRVPIDGLAEALAKSIEDVN